MNLILLSFRLLRREFHAGELRLLTLALVVAVAAVTAVGVFTDRVRLALLAEAAQLLGADLVLAADHPLSESLVLEARQMGLQLARTVGFPSMVMSPGGFRMVDVKAVDATYPLRGQLALAQSVAVPGDSARGAPPVGSVWIEPRLGQELGVAPGEWLQLGQHSFLVAAYLTQEPDRGVNFLGVAPRLMLNLDDLAATGLIQTGARVTYRLLFAGERGMVQSFSGWLKQRLERGERLEEGSRQEIRSALERAQRFLGLSSLLTVILAAVAMALAVARYSRRHLDSCALLRCLGATRGEVFQLYLGQFILLGVLGTCVGLALGYAAHFGLYQLLAGVMALDLPLPGVQALVQGLVVGPVLLLGFALPPLLRLQRVSPLRVLRRELGLPSLPLLLAYGLGLGLQAGLVFWMAGDPRLGGAAVLAFLVALGGFALLARSLVWCLARLRHGGLGVGIGWRYGLANLDRHAWSVSLQILALALGFMALLLLSVIRGELLGAWEKSVPADAPNRFVINIQPDQVAPLAQRLAAAGWPAEMAPMVRGRLVRIGERLVGPLDYPEDERAQRLVEREFNLSWRADLPSGNRIEAGRWFGPEDRGQPLASVEAGLAKTLGISLGDQLVFSISGQLVPVRVVGFRALSWDSMRVNFFVLMPPGVLEAMPASYLTSFHLPAGGALVLMPILNDFPNLTVIDVEAMLAQLKGVIAQVAGAVQFIFLFTLMAGVLVLYGALISVFDERRQSLVIMRALGASRVQLRNGLLTEWLAVGGLAGLLAASGALVLGQFLAWRLFELVLAPAYWLLPVAMIGGGLVTAAAAALGLRKLLAASPLEAFRDSG